MRHGRLRDWVMWAGASLLGVLPFGEQGVKPAHACYNEVLRASSEDVRTVKAAEGTLEQRKFLWAGTAILRTVPAVRARRMSPGLVELVVPAVRVMSLLTVRTGGKWIERRSEQSPYTLVAHDDAARVANLEWAVESLRMAWLRGMHVRHGELRELLEPESPAPAASGGPDEPSWPSDPRDRTHLGEALEALPKYRAEASRLLEQLAYEDLLTSGYGYAALARLRADAGNSEAAAAALASCRKMIRRHTQQVCTLARPHPEPQALEGS